MCGVGGGWRSRVVCVEGWRMEEPSVSEDISIFLCKEEINLPSCSSDQSFSPIHPAAHSLPSQSHSGCRLTAACAGR